MDSALSSCYLQIMRMFLQKQSGKYKKSSVFKTGKITDIKISKREKRYGVADYNNRGNSKCLQSEIINII